MRRGLIALVLCFATALSTSAGAQPRSSKSGSRTTPRPGQTSAPAPPSAQSLGSRLGTDAARRLLRSPLRDARLRGVERIAALNDLGAAQVLVRSLEEDPLLASDDRVRLESVRALAPFAAREPVRSMLLRWVGEESASGGNPAGGTGLLELARQQAALALAACGDARVTELLAGLVMGDAGAAEPAANALRVYPPGNLEPLLTTRALGSVRVVQLLGRMGDLRAITRLRTATTKGDIAVRAAAVVSLAQLGDEYCLKAARGWLNQAGTSHAVPESTAQAMVLMRAAEAPRAMAVLLADQQTRSAALQLAFDAPTVQVSPSLAGYLTIATPAQRPLTLLALARSGGAVALKTLQKQMGPARSPDPDAVFALAHLSGEGAGAQLDALLGSPASRRLGVRASLVRLAALGERPGRLGEALGALYGSRDPADQELAAFGKVLTGELSVGALIGRNDPALVRGACRAAWGTRSQDRQACAALLSDKTQPAMRDALAQALGGEVVPANVSSHVLLDWAERSDPMAVVFARALGSRDNETLRPRIRQLLASGDPTRRAQVALGLAFSPSPSAASLLTEAYRFESEPLVRRAIVRALSAFQAPQSRSVLQTAARLDPDDQLRELSRLALTGTSLQQPTWGNRIAWIVLSASDPQPRPGLLGRPLVVVPATGFAVGAVADDDGYILVPGLPPGPVRVVLAPSAASILATPP